MELQGTIIQVLPTQEGVGRSGTPWKLQPYVLETLDQYRRNVYFEVFGEERMKSYQANVGDSVTISFDLESTEYNGRWFTKVRAWKITLAPDMQPAGEKTTNVVRPNVNNANHNNVQEEETLPF